jgi:chromosome segregation ATPase
MKKPARDPRNSQLESVVAAVKHAAHLSGPSRAMLAATVKSSLGLPIEDRHEYQEKVVQMIGETLEACQKGFADSLAELEAKVAGSDDDRAARSAASAEVAAQLEAKTQDCTEKEATLEKIHEDVGPKKAALAAAQKEQKGLDKKLEKAASDRARYDEAIAGTYTQLVEGTWDDVKGAKGLLKQLAPFCKELKVEFSLMTSLGSAVEKKPEDRGEFDKVVLGQLGDALKERAANLAAAVDGGPAETERCAAEVSRCQQELDHTVQAEATAQEAFDAAEAEKQELKKDVKAKAKAVASFEVDAAKIISDRDDAVSTLEEFRSGPLAAFAALKVFSSAPPETEVVLPTESLPAAVPAA